MESNITGFNEEQISAAHNLVGVTLKTGWTVTERHKPKPGSSGGHFSVCYLVEKDGKPGFMKVLNVLSFLSADQDMLTATKEALEAFEFEKELCNRCKNKNFSRVSRMHEAERENFPGFPLLPNVYYMIFEKADKDVREHINYSKQVDLAWKLRSLHNVATGLKQLHSIEVSHQDLKPSNVFIFGENSFKIGDLGRSLSEDVIGPHSDLPFAGDTRYLPPEYWHKFILSNPKDRIFAVDMYLLGSMASYYITGQNIFALTQKYLNPNIQILLLEFDNAIDYWVQAYDKALLEIESHMSDYEEKDKLISTIRMLSHPDPRQRGHIKNVAGVGSNFKMERFVELFNLLARRAERRLTNA